MKILVSSLASFLISALSFAQAGDLMIKSGGKGMYVEHKAAAKENFYSIGRLYHTHPKFIAAFNGLDMSKGLSLGQTINIPLTDTNFSQKVFEGVPVFYKTTEKETLANISVKYKPAINNLRVWNQLTADNVPGGAKLIVGFLVTNEMQDKVVKISRKTLVAEESVSNVKKAEAQKKQMDPEIKKDEPAVMKETEVKKETEIKKEEPPVVKEESKKEPPVIIPQPATMNEEGSGYFKNNFYKQLKISPAAKDETVTSSIFKTTSGWQDSKYYLLINGVEPGTIVKITNPTNNKIIFAKVLYAMDKVRENQGVDIRISDAAASSLAVTETDKFILKVNY